MGEMMKHLIKKLKVDYANEDHYFCDEYLQKKIKEQNNNPNNKTPSQSRYFTGKKRFRYVENE